MSKINFHTSQNKKFFKQSDRKEILYLAEWLDEMIKNLYSIINIFF